MFNSHVLDVGIGLALMFFFQSILISGINELLVSLLSARGKTLRKYLALAMDTYKGELDGFFTKFAKSPFMSTLQKNGKFPSFISCSNFTDGVIETLTRDDLSTDPLFDKVKRGLGKLPDSDFKKVMEQKLDQAKCNVDAFRTSIDGWFTDYMGRVSAWYRRKTKIFIYGFSFIVTVALNVDAFRVMNELWKNEKVRDSVISLAQNVATDQMKSLKVKEGTDTLQAAISQIQSGYQQMHVLDYPITWEYEYALNPENAEKPMKDMTLWDKLKWTWGRLTLEKIMGFIVTTIAASIGAPIWYELIKNMLKLREPAKC